MTIQPPRRLALLLGASLAATSLPLLTLSGAADAAGPATTTYVKTVPYRCDVSVTDLGVPIVLPDFDVAAAISFTIPAELKPNRTVDPTKINVELNMPESLRYASTGLLEAVAADGASTNAYLFVQDAAGQRTTYKIPKLSAPKSEIPQTKGTPWIIKATGFSPEVRVPNSPNASIVAPERFDIDATLYKADGSSQPIGLSCDTRSTRTLAKIAIGEKTIIKSLVPARIKANQAGSFVVQIRGASTVPTSGVSLIKGDKAIANGTLNSKGNVRLSYPKLGQLGRRTFIVRYFGDENHAGQDQTVTLDVVR